MSTFVRRYARTAAASGDGWNSDRVDTLGEMWPDGWSASQIADRIGGGLSRNAVIGKAHRLGLSRADKPPAWSNLKSLPANPSRRRGADDPEISPPERPAPQPLTAKRNRGRGDNGGDTLTRINAGAVTAIVKARARREAVLEEAEQGGPFVCDGVMKLPPDESPYAVSLVDAKEHHCRFPLGNPFDTSFRFCGTEKLVGSSYCARHFILCTRQVHRISEAERERIRAVGRQRARTGLAT